MSEPEEKSWAVKALENPTEAPLMDENVDFATQRRELLAEALAKPNKVPALLKYVARHDLEIQNRVFGILDETIQVQELLVGKNTVRAKLEARPARGR